MYLYSWIEYNTYGWEDINKNLQIYQKWSVSRVLYRNYRKEINDVDLFTHSSVLKTWLTYLLEDNLSWPTRNLTSPMGSIFKSHFSLICQVTPATVILVDSFLHCLLTYLSEMYDITSKENFLGIRALLLVTWIMLLYFVVLICIF